MGCERTVLHGRQSGSRGKEYWLGGGARDSFAGLVMEPPEGAVCGVVGCVVESVVRERPLVMVVHG